MEPHVDFFAKFFAGHPWSEKKGKAGLLAPISGFALQRKPKVVYPLYSPSDSNRGWHGDWFYIWNLVEAPLLKFTGGRLTRLESWAWGPTWKHESHMEVLEPALQ